jgi:hypothetical protein
VGRVEGKIKKTREFIYDLTALTTKFNEKEKQFILLSFIYLFYVELYNIIYILIYIAINQRYINKAVSTRS